MEAELRAAWVLDVGTSAASQAVLDELLARHREAHRHYHTVTHVAHVLRTVDEIGATVAVADPVAVRLGAWFHDAVYDPRSATNEADSAALAARLLPSAAVGAQRVEAVQRLVVMTAGHAPSADDEAVLCDADLGVLAAGPAGYSTYVRQVRAEYAHVDDDSWRVGRAAVLQTLLDLPRLFHTVPMQAREARARANLATELHELQAGGSVVD